MRFDGFYDGGRQLEELGCRPGGVRKPPGLAGKVVGNNPERVPCYCCVGGEREREREREKELWIELCFDD